MGPKPVRDWTLRARITASMLGLLIVLCLTIGVVTQVALKNFLMGQLDSQLTTAAGRFNGPNGSNGPSEFSRNPPQNESGNLNPGGQSDGTINAHIVPGGAISTQIWSAGNYTSLGDDATKVLATAPADGQPHTVQLPGHGRYRVNATQVEDGDVLLTGLPLASVNATLSRLALVVTALAAASLLIVALAGALIVRAALRPLRRVTTIASRVADMPLDEGEVALAVRVPDPNPHTEVGQVGVALNRMLENVSDALNARHQSETRVRQFVADASHELRTPLASIRGYAELTRRSRDVAPPDIAHAMSRVESEAGRMTTLVEDLLLLARLDAGRPLESAEVDLTRLTVDAVSDAHAAGLSHHWHLDVPDDPITVRGDSARLHQVLANILANARTHTPPDSNVRVSLRRQGNSVVLEVSDDGPGIPSDLIDNIFERFSRGEESRSRGTGSTGLGLAIADAVVRAHAGQISVSSEAGHTVFTVQFPTHGRHEVVAQDSASMADDTLKV